MIFFSAALPNVGVNVYGAEYLLNPLTYPEIDTEQILIAEDALASRLLKNNSGNRLQQISFEVEKLPDFPKPFSITENLKPFSKVLIIRGGGIGDVLMSTPAIRELRKRLPENVQLNLATFQWNRPFFSDNPHLSGVTPLPFTLAEILDADYYLEFTDTNAAAGPFSMIDYYLMGSGLDPESIEDKSLVLNTDPLLDKETVDGLNAIRSSFRYLVYLNGLASDRLRDVSSEVLDILPDRFPDIAFIVSNLYFERYQHLDEKILNRGNVVRLDTGNSLKRYVTALLITDAVVTTDSSASHIAAALKKPCLTLFGPGHSERWASYYPTVRPLEAAYTGSLCHSPCGRDMLSEFGQDQAVSEKRCPEAVLTDQRFSPCLASISADRLTEAFSETLKAVA